MAVYTPGLGTKVYDPVTESQTAIDKVIYKTCRIPRPVKRRRYV